MKSSNAKYDSSSSKRARIAIVGAVPPPYHGVTIMAENILRSELRERFELIHVDTSDHRDVHKLGRLDIINVYLGIWHVLKSAYLFWTGNPHIVYITISQGALGYLRDSLFIALAKLSRRKVIVHLHGGMFDKFYQQANCTLKLVIKLTLAKVNCVIVLGECLKCLFYDFVPPETIQVVPNGIEDLATDGLTTQPRIVDDKISVVFLSTLSKSKGIMELIRAIPLVIKQNDKVRFVLAGTWFRENIRKEALQFIDRNKLWHYVDFPGRVLGKEKLNLLRNTDIFVLPPVRPEGQPLALLEAMSMAIPIITTDQGCIAETVLHGVNGFIVEPGNVDELARRIIQLAEDTELRQVISKENRKRYLRLYTGNIFAQNIGSVFAQVADTAIDRMD
jgi:glycosyltransferase involved in cell wall biosynthesis